MKINLSHFEETQSARKSLFEKLLLPADLRLDFAYDIVHGLNELTRSLADLHPHKRSIAVLGAQPPPIADIAMQFASQGFSVQTIPVSFLKMDDGALKVAWEALKKDTLFVLCSAVEPLTGAIYPFDWIRHEATKKNIFTLIYQSPDALAHGLIIPESPFEGICADPLWGQTPGLNLLLKGERCLGDKLLWSEPRYELEAIKNLEDALLKPLATDLEDKTCIVNFENKIKMQLGSDTHFLGDDIPRLYDRAVLFVDGVGGESLVYELKKNKIESFTGAACAWNSPNLNSWLPQLGLANNWVQSSLILPLAEIRKSSTLDHLGTAITSLRKTSGTV